MFRLPRQGLPRPILATTGYHACVFIPVITPELSRSTIPSTSGYHTRHSSSYFIVYLSPAFTPSLLLLLHHHLAPHATTYSTMGFHKLGALRCWANRAIWLGYPYLHDESANKNVHVSNASIAVCVCISKKQRSLSFSRATARTSTETWSEPFFWKHHPT